MKLLHIASHSDDCIEEALVPVPDKFDRDAVLGGMIGIVKEPYIESILIVGPAPGHVNRLSEYRPYFG